MKYVNFGKRPKPRTYEEFKKAALEYQKQKEDERK